MKIFIGLLIFTVSLFAAQEDGSFKFSPYIKMNNEYNSNFLRTTQNQANVIMMKILPGLSLENRNNQDTDIKLNANVSYKYFLSLSEQYKDIASNNSDFDLNAALNMAFWKTGNFSVYTNDDFSKLSYSGYSNPIRKLSNIFNLGVQTTPFGKALKFRLGYNFNFNKTVFTDDLSDYTRIASESQDNMEHNFNFGIEWRFLPKTALLSTTSYGMILHYNADAGTKASLNIVDSTPIISKVGLKGVITPKLALKLMLGWAYVIYETGGDFNSFVSDVEFTYNFSQKTSLVLGFRNSFKDVLFSNYLSYYSTYANTKISLTNNLTFGMGINADLNIYPTVSLGNNVTAPNSRTDIDARFNSGLSYSYKNYDFELKYDARKIFTDFYTLYQGKTTKYDYLQHKVSLNLYMSF